ncbi:MAG TPA: hypothetical protein VHS99_20820 [Chloroflexota bacterium]|nr:hypothetical protein [Chloroflexota bacterium]
MTTAKADPALQPTEPLPPLRPDQLQETRLLPPVFDDTAVRPDGASPTAGHRRRLHPALTAVAAWVVAGLILAGAGAVSWWLIQPQLARPFVYDEAAFAFAGKAVAQTGLPLSNVGHMQTETPGDFSRRFNWALWHPPLYVFTLGYAFRQWGETETVARLLGVVCNAATALLVFATATVTLWRRTRAAPVYAAAGSALYVTNPFVIQSSMLLDIDGTVLVVTIALLALAYVLVMQITRPLSHPLTWGLLALAALSLGLSLWAKMTTSLALVAAASLYRLVGTRPWQPWRLLLDFPIVALGGGALFLATWWAACMATGMPFALPFQIMGLQFGDAAASPRAWRDNPRLVLDLISYVALWVSPYFILLFLWAGLARLGDLALTPFVRLAQRLRRRQSGGEAWGAWPIDFVLLAGGAIALTYLIKLAASFPKYHVTMMPLWAIGIAYLLWRYVPQLSWWELPVYAIVLAGMAGYFVSFVGDQYILFRGYDFVGPILIWPAALGFAFLVLGATLGKHHLPRQLAILGVLLTLAWSWGVNLAQSQADYSTAYNYGTTGQREAAAYLNSILRPEEPYVASRDVAYYTANQQYVDQDTFWEHLGLQEAQGITSFDGRIAGYPRVNVLALFLWDPELGRLAHGYLADRFEVSFQSGPYIVFVRTVP